MLRKILIPVLVASAVTALGIYESKAPHTAKAAPTVPAGWWPAHMDVYPGVELLPMSRSLTVGRDNRMRMAWFQTQDEPLEIAKFYEARWRQAGYFVSKDVNPYGGRVSAVDPTSGILRQVTMFREGGTTSAFLSMVLGRLHDVDKTPEDIPVYPGAEGRLSFSADDPVTSSDVVTFMDGGTVEDNVAFYRQKMREKGYSLHKDQDKEGIRMLIFRRGNEEVTVSIYWDESLKVSKVHVARIRGKGE